MRDRLMAIGVVAAVIAVWAIGLGIVDRAAPRKARVSIEASPTARFERRPALYVVTQHQSTAQAGDAPAAHPVRAIPIALVEPNGELRAPLPAMGESETWKVAERMFVSTYFRPGSLIAILQGGASAGIMRIMDVADRDGPIPTGRGVCEGTDLSSMAPTVGTDTVLLGVSDPRIGSSKPGIEPMRASDREVAVQLLRRAVIEHYPDAHVDGLDAVRVRAVDLDHDGSREIIASAVVRIRTSPQQHAEVGCFLIAEPRSEGAGGYRTACATVGDKAADAESRCLFSYVDQIDLSAATYDEVVVGCAKADRHFIVMRRGDEGWRETYRSPVASK
jgi:hypothetical protein